MSAQGGARQIDLFVNYVKASAGRMQEAFEASDDEWMPRAFICLPDGSVAHTSLPVEILDSPEARTEFARVMLIPSVEDNGATELALLFPMWGVAKPAGYGTVEEAERLAEQSIPAAMDPERQEVIVVLAIDSEESQTWIAEVERGEGPPSHGEWQGPMLWLHDKGDLVPMVQEALRSRAG